MFDKISSIRRKGSNTLQAITAELDRERLDAGIAHSVEKISVRNELRKLQREKQMMKKQSWQAQIRVQGRDKSTRTYYGSEKERKRLLKAYSIRTQQDVYPDITCTQANVPRLLRRSIPSQSEFHNWVTGLPRIDGTRNPMVGLPRRERSSSLCNRQGNSQEEPRKEPTLKHRSSKVQDVRYSVPISTDRKPRFLTRQDTQKAISTLLSRYCSRGGPGWTHAMPGQAPLSRTKGTYNRTFWNSSCYSI